MVKRVALVFLMMMMVVLSSTPALAHQHGITVYFNGKQIFFDTPPVIEEGRTLVPFRAIFEKVGAAVSYDSETQMVTGIRDNISVSMTIGSTSAVVNGVEKTLDVAPRVVSRRTMVPLRFVGEALGASVSWDASRQRIDINDPNYPRRGGSVTLAMFSAPAGIFNPSIASNTYDANVNAMIFDSLWRTDEALLPQPALAEYWTVSEDNKTITFYLRDGVTWHDGTPFTVDDVYFTFMGFMDPKYKGPRSSGWDALVGYDEYRAGTASTVSGMRIVGNDAIAFELKEVNAPFFLRNTGNSIIPKHLYKDVPVEDWGTAKDPNNAKPIGTGAFKFVQHQPGQFVILDKNPNYFNGAPYLDRVIWRVVAQEVAVGELETGRVDWSDIPVKDLATAQRNPRISIHEFPDLVYQYMGMNTGRAPLNDVNLRKAIAYAIDRKAIIDGIMNGHAAEMNTPIHPLMWPYNDNVEKYSYDQAKANALFDEAGWKMGSNGVRMKDGKPLKLTLLYPTGNVQRENTAPVVQAMLKAVGVEVELNRTDFATLLKRADAPTYDFDLLFLGFRVGIEPDPKDIHGKDAIKQGGFNRQQWWTPKSEELLKAAAATMDIEERKAYYAEWQKQFNDEIPVLHLYASNAIQGVQKRIGNFRARVISSVWNIDEWFINN